MWIRLQNRGGSLQREREQAACSLCGFDDVPRAVVVHVVFTADILAVAMVVMALGLYFLKRQKQTKQLEKLSGLALAVANHDVLNMP